MEVAFEPFLPGGMRWWQLFDVVVVSACKPDFFTETRRPLYSVAGLDVALLTAHSSEGRCCG